MKTSVLARPAALAGTVLLVPLVMTLVDRDKPPGEGWHWSASDFLVMGALLFSAGLAYQLIARKLSTSTTRAALALGILVLVVGVWVELAVGGVSQIVTWLVR